MVWTIPCSGRRGDSSDGTKRTTEASLQQCLDTVGGGVWTRQGLRLSCRVPQSLLASRVERHPENLGTSTASKSRGLSTAYKQRAPYTSKIYDRKRPKMPPERPRASLADRIKNSRFVDYIWRAFRSAAYPIQGIWYFSKQGKFWPLWAGRLLPLSLVSLTVYLILFLFAYLPQVAFLAIWQGRGAWFSAMILTLGEGLVLIQALFEGFFVDEARVDVFDVSLHLPRDNCRS